MQAAIATVHAAQSSKPLFMAQSSQVQTFNSNLFERFIDYTDRKPTTIKGYVTCIRQFVEWLDCNGITQPKREDIKAYRDHLTSSDLATGTQTQYLRAVKHFFKWTASEGLYPNIADNIHGAKVRRDIHKKDALQREDVAQIASTIDRSDEQGRRLYAMYLLCVICGLRTIELHRADVGDLKTVGGTTYLYLQGKGHDDKDAPVLLIPEVKAAIDEYLQIRTAEVKQKSPLFTATSNKGKPGAKIYKKVKDENGNEIKVFDRISDGRIATTTISTMIKEMLVNAGYDSDRLTAHSLRHTSGTGAHKAGIDLYGVQHLMRHCDPATSEIYIHDDNHKAAEEKGRKGIYDYYFKGVELTPIMPELEAEIMTMTAAEQAELLAQIRARKGADQK